jgi:hypothetical protein
MDPVLRTGETPVPPVFGIVARKSSHTPNPLSTCPVRLGRAIIPSTLSPLESRNAKDGRMIVGVPKEIKRDEYRVGMLPVGVEEMTRAGHRVLVETGAGLGSGLADHAALRRGEVRGGRGHPRTGGGDAASR